MIVAPIETSAVEDPMEDTVVEDKAIPVALGYKMYPAGTRPCMIFCADADNVEDRDATALDSVVVATTARGADVPPVMSVVILP